jgi:hypothetical protein
MSVILVYVAFVIIGDSIAVAVATLIERYSEPASLLVFFALFILVFWIGWWLAVRVTERYLVRQN